MSELKPCPFCGAEAKLIGKYEGEAFLIWVECRRCFARSGRFWPNLKDEGKSVESFEICKNGAIETWNRRADDGKAD